MISEKQEQSMSDARGKARQDRRVPFLINRENFRLMPNTPLIRKLADYIPYDGNVTDDLSTRRSYVEGRGSRPRVINSMAEADVFDIGKATKDELVAFAFAEYGKMLDGEKDVRTLRKEFMAYIGTLDSQPLS